MWCPGYNHDTKPRYGIVKSHDKNLNVILIDIHNIGERFIDVPPGTDYKPGSPVLVTSKFVGNTMPEWILFG